RRADGGVGAAAPAPCGPRRDRADRPGHLEGASGLVRVTPPRSPRLGPVAAAQNLDTVSVAAQDPERSQPWAELGLKADEYSRIREILGRRPTSSELAMYSVMWSEHCSYKSTKVHLKQFSELPQETPLGKTLAGIGEN